MGGCVLVLVNAGCPLVADRCELSLRAAALSPPVGRAGEELLLDAVVEVHQAFTSASLRLRWLATFWPSPKSRMKPSASACS